MKSRQLLTCLQIPNNQIAANIAANHLLADSGEAHKAHPTFMADETPDQSPIFDLPEPNHIVAAAREDMAAVRSERHSPDVCFKPFQCPALFRRVPPVQFVARLDVPQSHRLRLVP